MVRVAIALLLMVLPATAWAQAEKRVALVIGNSAYQHTPKLTNPKNDATDMVAVLERHGFQVLEGFDLDKAAFDRKVRDFATALSSAQVGVFFYAGHGLQVSGHNYLVPIDAQLSTASALDFEMVRLDLVHRTMEREAQTNILFLDACRDNPLARNLARAMGTRSTDIGRGLAHVESGVGTLISFSTQPGAVALDGSGRNSPFAGALVKQLSSTNNDLSAILIDVRNDVMRETQRKQVPWEHSALTGRFYFSSPPPAQPQQSEAERAWRWVKDSTNQSVLENFIKEFGDTPFGDEAKARLAELKRQQVAIATPPPAGPTPPTKEPLLPGLLDKTLDVVLPRDKQAPAPIRCDGVEIEVAPLSGLSAFSESRCLKPGSGEVFKDCPDCPEMVLIPAGEFMMGSPAGEEGRHSNEGPQRKVGIAAPFAAGKFEVTFAEWDACVTAGGCKHRPSDEGWGRGKRPVMNVSWDDITREYLPWLLRKTGKTYRLLTEAEWEYAARAGSATRYHFGNDEKGLCTYGNVADETAKEKYKDWTVANCRDGYVNTAPVGSFKPNAFGVHDMHGNVWEWVHDCYKGSYAEAPLDGSAVTSGDCRGRVLRGGSWIGNPGGLRSAYRNRNNTANRDNYFGFRVGRTLTP
jgi:formylglycine-generating enzyme required for sulfatase activity